MGIGVSEGLEPTSNDFAGQVVLVTGAARGQGASIAQRFAVAGALVVVTDVLDGGGATTAASIGGDRAVAVELDVTAEDRWQHAVETALATFGRLDVLINNAGILHSEPLLTTSTDAFRRVLDVNLLGAFLGIRTA
ncbi:MAG TPA: SDR family NAD(P)-dependent oxidoreductase, partial [Ilumatobacteraceae bacterium]|nr:SDR family NAD(P)-dependent oxidoreductase [Ilumatobacteraceae bacterium]